MVISPKNITILPNQSFIMNCLAVSSGLVRDDCWTKRNGILPQTAIKSCVHNILFDPLSGEQTTKNVYNLAVYNVQPSDEGWYCCVATNEAGRTVDCAWLEVNSKSHANLEAYLYARNCEPNQKQHCKMLHVTKTFDITEPEP